VGQSVTRLSPLGSDPEPRTRMFKGSYGMSPREWQHQADTRRSAPTGVTIDQ